MKRTNSDFRYASTKASPCELCGNASGWCKRTDDGCVLCMNTTAEAPPAGWTKTKTLLEGATFRRSEDVKARSAKADAKRDLRPEQEAKAYAAAITEELRAELATALGCTVDAVVAMKIGWRVESGGEGCWTFPERDGRGYVVGINRRYRNGKKRRMPKDQGHASGISIPDVGLKPEGLLLAVEGGSDVLAVYDLGIAVVGRPNNVGGVPYLAEYCEGRAADVVIVGEFDMKTSGLWPGKTGAVRTAGRLAQAWGEPVKWCLPPDKLHGEHSKDLRDFIGFRRSQGATNDEIRDAIVYHAKEFSTTVEVLGADPDLGGRPVIFNVVDDITNKKAPKLYYVAPDRIDATLERATDRWPRRTSGKLFTVEEDADRDELPSDSWIRWLPKTPALFAWIYERMEPRFTEKEAVCRETGAPRNPISKPEYFEHLQATAKSYEGVEILPHHPRQDDLYYLPCDLPESDGSALKELRDRLNAATEIDRDLMIAALLTPGWGGPPGERPAFIFQSEHGSGVGKSSTASMFARAWGGEIRIDPGDLNRFDEIRKQLVAFDRRVVLLDNVRGKLAQAGLESALTAREITGHRMYVSYGFVRRNLLTWYITSNAPSLGKDVADRAVIISLGKEQHKTDFSSWRDSFLRERRASLLADLIAMLAGPDLSEIDLDRRDRWAPWQIGVLSKFENGPELADAITGARPGVDADRNEAEGLADVIRSAIQATGRLPDAVRFGFIARDLLEWVRRAGTLDDHDFTTPQGAAQRLSSLARQYEDLLPVVQVDKRVRSSRQWVWAGRDAPGDSEVLPFYPAGTGEPAASTLPPADPEPETDLPF